MYLIYIYILFSNNILRLKIRTKQEYISAIDSDMNKTLLKMHGLGLSLFVVLII